MDARGEIGDLEAQIDRLMKREKLTEDEVKKLCDKVCFLRVMIVMGAGTGSSG